MRRAKRIPRASAALVVIACAADASADGPARNAVELDVHAWRVIERESGKDNYFALVEAKDMPFLRARYKPPMETAVLGVRVADEDRDRARVLRWKWRAMTFPDGGDECADGKEDSAAVVYVSWKRGLKWYVLKYVWSSVGRRGATCDRKRNPFAAQDTYILESGGPTGQWKDEAIDLRAAFRRHFENGDSNADVPGFVGVGIMSDGDQTNSESAADWARFVLER
jgi:hypothetical protein